MACIRYLPNNDGKSRQESIAPNVDIEPCCRCHGACNTAIYSQAPRKRYPDRYKLSAPTFKALDAIRKAPERRHVLEIACHATEFRLFPIKQAEKGLFRWINEHTGIPYPIPQAISEPWHKVFLLVQIDLQRKGWPNKISVAGRKELFGETGRIHKLLDRVVRCLVDILGQRQDGRGVNVALDVLRSIKAKAWQGNEMELLQLEGIGAAKMEKLVQARVKSIRQLSELECYHIERLLGRNPPFGHQLRHRLERFPQLTIRFEVLGMYEPPTTLKEDGKGGGRSRREWLSSRKGRAGIVGCSGDSGIRQ